MPQTRSQLADLIAMTTGAFKAAFHAYKAYLYHCDQDLLSLLQKAKDNQQARTWVVENISQACKDPSDLADIAYDLALLYVNINSDECVRYAKMIKDVDKIFDVAKALDQKKVLRLDLYNHIARICLENTSSPFVSLKNFLKSLKEIYPIYTFRALDLFRNQPLSSLIQNRLEQLIACSKVACLMFDFKQPDDTAVCMTNAYELIEELKKEELIVGWRAIAKAHNHMGEHEKAAQALGAAVAILNKLPDSSDEAILTKAMYALTFRKFDPHYVEMAKTLYSQLKVSFRIHLGCKILAFYNRPTEQESYNTFFNQFFADANLTQFKTFNNLLAHHPKSFTQEKAALLLKEAEKLIPMLLPNKQFKAFYKLSLHCLHYGLKYEIKEVALQRRAKIVHHLVLALILTVVTTMGYLYPALRPLPAVIAVVTHFIPE
jgi:hypothetical protein